jgi:glycosyltransferase involved in cell wall biosynthesis
MEKSVLIVGTFPNSATGSHSVCADLAIRLAESRWKVIATSTKRVKLSRLLDMMSTLWFKRDGYAVAQVDVYSGRAFLWAEAACQTLRWLGKPYLLTLHGGNLPAFALRWPGRVRRLLQSASAVTTPSQYLLEKMIYYRRDLYLLPNPLDLSTYKFRLRGAPQPRLVWLRAFHSVYNPSLAPKVLDRLVGDFPGIYLTMIGPDKGDRSLQAMLRIAKKLDVSDRLGLPGAVSKKSVPDWIDKSDIFLNTTNVDNTPISVLEAMACGLCVVSTNVGGIPYLLENEHDALLVPPNDPEAMAHAVRRILTEAGLARHLSQNARHKAELFDWPNILPKWEALLTNSVEGRPI